jgi:hypothetical protein
MSRTKAKKPNWPRRALPPLWGKDVKVTGIKRMYPVRPVFEVRMYVDNKYYLVAIKEKDELGALANIARRQQKVPRNHKDKEQTP